MDNIIEQWLEEEEELIEGVDVDSDEELESDNVEEQCEESNTEQEYTDDEYEGESTSGDDNIGSIAQNKFYIGKDQTKWKKKVPPQNSRTRSHNIITHLPGLKSNAKNEKSHMECFSLFFDDSVISIIKKVQTSEFKQFRINIVVSVMQRKRMKQKLELLLVYLY